MNKLDEVREGFSLPALEWVMEKDVYFAYNKLVNNMNPLHSDQGYARSLGFDDIVVAGVYTYSFVPRVVEEWLGESGRVKRVEIKFEKPVCLGRRVRFEGKVTKRSGTATTIEVVALSPEGVKHLTAEILVQ